MAGFDSINYVPPRLRKLRGVPLSLTQVNAILTTADDHMVKGLNFPEALAKAREEFQVEHESESGAWIRRAG